jgi:undecaprenyl phosphate-alpha-L-ara4FN deformylase
VIRAATADGHEIGLHAWDHHAWQAHVESMTRSAVENHLRRGLEMLTDLAGRPPTCSAAPGWKCTDTALLAKTSFPFRYNSDCRGDRVFRPCVDGRVLDQVQVPSSLPTWDEVVGRTTPASDFNAFMLGRLAEEGLNVLTVHAEVEGIAEGDAFEAFLDAALARGAAFVPLGALADETAAPGRIESRVIPGREGTVACLVDAEASS